LICAFNRSVKPTKQIWGKATPTCWPSGQSREPHGCLPYARPTHRPLGACRLSLAGGATQAGTSSQSDSSYQCNRVPMHPRCLRRDLLDAVDFGSLPHAHISRDGALGHACRTHTTENTCHRSIGLRKKFVACCRCLVPTPTFGCRGWVVGIWQCAWIVCVKNQARG
jgi:hypothetical protein